ncbi:MAG: hypothetical protein IT561_19465 [Alphaproteobacteria bacterium]|nr:hypothetical protein [Alphaproteobacteria bacterium]
MIRRLAPLALVLALAACAAPSGREMYPTQGTALAPTAAPLEWEDAPEPVELPDPAATRDAPRGPPPLPGDPIPPNRRMGAAPSGAMGIPPGFGDLPAPPGGRRAY